MSEWISVKDRLPVDGSRFLVSYRFWRRGVLLTAVTVCKWRNGYFGELEFFGDNFEPTFRIPTTWRAGNATHWMPLPEPPK